MYEYFEYSMIFHPEIKILISFNAKDNIWNGKISAFQGVWVKSPVLGNVISEIETILNNEMGFVMNTERKTFVKEIRVSNMAIEYSGKYYLCIYKTRHSDIYNIITTGRNKKNELGFLHKIINVNEVNDLLHLCTSISIMPPECDGLDGRHCSLKIKSGLDNYTSLNWWSGAAEYEEWKGLYDVENKLNEIHKKYFENEA